MYSVEEIKKILPHREPFLMIDKVVEVDENYCVAQKAAGANEWYFQGHFENRKVMPGVLQLEAIAQAGAFIILRRDNMKGKIGYLARIKSAKFSKMVVPGDILTIETKIVDMRNNIGTGKGTVRVNGDLVCKAEIVFVIGNEIT